MPISPLLNVTPLADSDERAGTAMPRADRRAAFAPAGADGAAPATAATPVAAPAAAPLRSRGSASDPDIQQRLSDAQQARDFLDMTAAQLEGLRADLSAKLAGLQVQDSQLQAKLRQAASTAKTRQSASAGSLDPQLRFSSPAPATQRFSVRGLDLQALQSGAPETLVIATGGGAAPASVSIDPGASAPALVQRFDQALAPSGVRVGSDASGALIFSVAESAWPAVRDNLAIKGAGIRFPTGQLNRVKSDPEPAAVQPADWQVGASGTDSAQLRRSLQQVSQALERVRQARASVSRSLAAATQQVEQTQPLVDSAGAAALAGKFQTASQQPGYQAFASVSAALIGISRSRVQSLLVLPPAS